MKASFDMARHMKPAIIFIDDVDLLCSLQSGSESESVRKELNAQMQGNVRNVVRTLSWSKTG